MSFTQSESAGASPPRPWPADRVERWPIGRLIPYANNPRLHTEADRDKIATSILKWGWTMPVLAEGTGTSLIAAEMTGRVCCGLELCPRYVDVVVRSWQVFTGRAAMHLGSGQSFNERTQRQDHDPSGAAHGKTSVCRE